MFRFLTIALLAGAALPATAIAQDIVQPHADGVERGNWRVERPAMDAAPPADRASHAAPRQRSFSPPTAPPAALAQAQSDRGGWRGNRGGDGNRGGWNGNRGGDGNRGTWNGNRGGDGNRGGWRGQAPTAPTNVAPPPAPPPVVRNDGQRRDWNRSNDPQRTWSQNGTVQREWNRDNGRRDWNRDNARRDWNRNDGRRDWNRDNGRRDWNDRGWDGNRRWDGNRNARSWDRGWRNDRRYDWLGYRNSNRYAYRWPQYYAPRGWNYGYQRFGIGTTLFAGLFARDYWIGNPYDYRLPPVDWPFQWVRYYDDALLVDTTTGQVVDVIPGIFW